MISRFDWRLMPNRLCFASAQSAAASWSIDKPCNLLVHWRLRALVIRSSVLAYIRALHGLIAEKF